MKLALFTRTTGTSPMALETWADGFSGYIRVSEFVDVQFPELPMETVIPQRVAAIDRDIEEITRDFAERMEALKTRKSELLAIAYRQETVE